MLGRGTAYKSTPFCLRWMCWAVSAPSDPVLKDTVFSRLFSVELVECEIEKVKALKTLRKCKDR